MRGRRWGGQALGPFAPKRPPFQTANLYPPPSRKQQTLHTGALTSALQNLEAGGERNENQKAGGETDGGVTPGSLPTSQSCRVPHLSQHPSHNSSDRTASRSQTTMQVWLYLLRWIGSGWVGEIGVEERANLSPPRFVLSRLLLSLPSELLDEIFLLVIGYSKTSPKTKSSATQKRGLADLSLVCSRVRVCLHLLQKQNCNPLGRF